MNQDSTILNWAYAIKGDAQLSSNLPILRYAYFAAVVLDYYYRGLLTEFETRYLLTWDI